MKLCDVKAKGPTEKAVLIFRLEDMKLKENEEILSHISSGSTKKTNRTILLQEHLSMQLTQAKPSPSATEGSEPRHGQSP